MAELIIYTDGASRGNPGPGGYGVVMMFGQHIKEFSAGFRKTTNNRMELLAVIIALESLTKKQIPVKIFTDSKYVVDSVEKKWLNGWLRTNFSGGKKNKDLWIRYAAIAKEFTVKFHWVKGHADNPYNNRCDLLATSAADDKANLGIDRVYEAENP
ncbi:ribonuclease HI [Arachidicoccus ginsenosidivorans]|jgi:ribonuclease HI|uniref:ribonuclease H n=1 Tax=Arachidicoccus ginsenosidivorans TaxID=496057 RepID=A0A5B8VK27_9BACT|nr:ribonuclease HI [Arachidicoccus ginsenosidivorans]QEC71391.1 ribonuclease HI [Arachidicoccus ginsenosidivorans]